MQTILGAGGGAGTEITRELSNYTKDIRLLAVIRKRLTRQTN